jgi:hypothetical protein
MMKNLHANRWLIGLFAALLLMAGGCADATDTEADGIERSSQSLERIQTVERSTNESEGMQAGSSSGLSKDGSQSKSLFGDWGLIATSSIDGTMITVSWEAQPGEEFKLCWEKAGDPALICSGSDQTTVVAGGSNYYSGTVYATIYDVDCDGEEYRVRVKRNAVSYRTTRVTMNSCSCSNPCPSGGWYDGANCYIGTPPEGTDAFIYDSNYYYTPVDGDQCPDGSDFDSQNCFVQAVPAGVDPFIYDNNFYYEACPGM